MASLDVYQIGYFTDLSANRRIEAFRLTERCVYCVLIFPKILVPAETLEFPPMPKLV
jgi:hypothetical protein